MTIFQQYLAAVLALCAISGGVIAKEYNVAVRAHHGIDVAHQQWQSTINVLNESIPDHKFRLLPIISLDEITRQAGQARFEFVLTNPSSFVELEQLYGAKAMLTLKNKRANTAQDRFGSVIFTHVRNEDIISFKDLKGKTLMAVSEPAFGGWRVAWMEMLEAEFDPYKDLKKLHFTKGKTQPEVVWAVRDRKVDAGVVRTDRLERMETAGEIDMRYFRIINNKDVKDFPFFLSTDLYPEWAFASMHGVPADLFRRVQQVLLSVSAGSQAATSGKYMGWVTPRDYRSVRHLMKKLQVGPYASE
ncbi:MAG: phosphate/phosphite/phosphonate ABC transporter substrate-binding protein [Gammaproteobacteria bacterium]|nr:phosphate/phosphite/phosphonate ABC transporter substrate-binding protein [Gammaproteobacteria bacterium]